MMRNSEVYTVTIMFFAHQQFAVPLFPFQETVIFSYTSSFEEYSQARFRYLPPCILSILKLREWLHLIKAKTLSLQKTFSVSWEVIVCFTWLIH